MVNSRGPTQNIFFMSPPATKILVPRILVPRSWYQDLGAKILVLRPWYQDPGTKILVPKKNGEPERRSLSVCRGARGAAGPPPGGLGGWKPPRNSRGSGGRQPPSKNNFMDPEPPSDHLQPLPTICQPPSTTFLPPSTTYRPPSPSTANHYHF